ncbi:hypothetical protein IV60_GL000821 [Lancefieldella rimae]|uniref:Haloacid dehalogenase-like hydrolase n=2 Tax=Lancefieldella rimae TaxID=1383 RepID=B9CM89_LANR4|nr:haloacid dehalogenase-like hydrolase [Lancefieldella rimae]EEE17604.1 hypothetical protein ATORI0001_1428 [Lancefieldella rimae ATCC 49626]KRO02385.1 hypothetical protein IV60_GL000821 [Lancefieldella rimae]
MCTQSKNKPIILAICYDFDKTLTHTDMQNQGFIQSLGYDIDEFWKNSNSLALHNDMDQNLAYMYSMSKLSTGKFYITKNSLKEYGEKISLYNGVKDWFKRINDYGKEHNVTVEHYIISSGLKEIIEGTPIAPEFKKIYASSFYYDKDNVARWPAQVVNYTDKTQYLFRIEKDVLDVNDQSVNNYLSPNKIKIPFRNIVYIGDSATDIPCMKLVNINGGHSIGVFNPKDENKERVFSLLNENRIKYFAAADYSSESQLESLVKKIIDRTEANEALEDFHYECIDLKDRETKAQDASFKKRQKLINQLEDSRTYATTHSVIAELEEIKKDEWEPSEIRRLFEIGEKNSQVSAIREDSDVKRFFNSLPNKE